MSGVRVAVIGGGFIGPVHVEALRRAGQHVHGVLGSSAEKSQRLAASLDVEHAYRVMSELLSDSQLQAVHIATPNRHHFEQAKAVLMAGKHVLCEKPLAMNTRETAELVQLANSRQLAAGVAYNIRYYPLCHEVAARIRQGDIGRVFHVNGSYVQDWLLKPTDYNWRVSASEGGQLRAVADIGTHWLDLIQYLLGEKVVSVCADLQTVHPERLAPTGEVETFSSKTKLLIATREVPVDTDDYGSLMLQFASGTRGSVYVSQVNAGRKNCLRYEIAGAHNGSYAWDSERPNELWLGHRDGANESLLRDPALLSESARAVTNYPGGHNEGFPDTFKQLFRTFYDYIARGDYAAPPLFPTFADGHYEVLLCEAVLRSHRERRWVDVAEVQPCN